LHEKEIEEQMKDNEEIIGLNDKKASEDQFMDFF